MKYLNEIKNKFISKGKLKHNKDKKELKDFLYVSAFPKSGSSFISLVLKELIKYDLVDLVYSHFGEQDLYEPKLENYLYTNTITKHHTLASLPNIKLFVKYNIKPIILTRNLPDTIVSLRDHLSKTMIWPHFHVPNNFNSLSIVEQHDFLIDFATPWYIYFFLSWKKVENDNILDIKFIQYENFYIDEVGIIREILDFWNFEFSNQEIKECIKYVHNLSKKQNRVNLAIMHRGQELLNKRQLEKLEYLTKYYQNVDFSSIT